MRETETPFITALRRLDQLLVQSEWLWRSQPFKEERPAWCQRLPQLRDKLLALSEEALAQVSGDEAALLRLLQPEIPQLSELQTLCDIPPRETVVLEETGPHFHSGIPGRKWQQVSAFAAAVGEVRRPILEWCGGKGHLGRLLGRQWRQPVATLERDDALCREGDRLAVRTRTEQRFYRLDVLHDATAGYLQGHHPVALHACGELHRVLLRQALAVGVEAFDIAPCCYHLGAGDHYSPFTAELQLRLSRDDLRLAVTETVTAAGREVVRRDREMAWKLGYDLLRRETCGVAGYLSIKPIDKGWLNLDFAGFSRTLAEREGRSLPEDVEWQCYERAGWRRQGEVMRLSLVRAAFRRALELWLVFDMASEIADHGYSVEVGRFCGRELTPRNLLITARRLSR